MIKKLDNGRKVCGLCCGKWLLKDLKAGLLEAGDLIDVVAGTIQLIVAPFRYHTKGVVTAVTNPGSKAMPMQVIEYQLEDERIAGRDCVLGSKEDNYYSKLYWEALSGK